MSGDNNRPEHHEDGFVKKRRIRNAYKTDYNKQNYSRISIWTTHDRKDVYMYDAGYRGYKDLSPYVRHLFEKDRLEILLEKVRLQEEIMNINPPLDIPLKLPDIEPEGQKENTAISPDELTELLWGNNDNSDNNTRISIWTKSDRKDVYMYDAGYRGYKDMSHYIRYLLEKDRKDILLRKAKNITDKRCLTYLAEQLTIISSQTGLPADLEGLEKLIKYNTGNDE